MAMMDEAAAVWLEHARLSTKAVALGCRLSLVPEFSCSTFRQAMSSKLSSARTAHPLDASHSHDCLQDIIDDLSASVSTIVETELGTLASSGAKEQSLRRLTQLCSAQHALTAALSDITAGLALSEFVFLALDGPVPLSSVEVLAVVGSISNR